MDPTAQNNAMQTLFGEDDDNDVEAMEPNKIGSLNDAMEGEAAPLAENEGNDNSEKNNKFEPAIKDNSEEPEASNGNREMGLFGLVGEENLEDDDEEDEDFDPSNPNAGDEYEESSSDEYGYKRYREKDPALYVPAPKRIRVSEDGKEIVEEEEAEPLSAQVLKDSTMLIARIMSFLDLKEKLRISVVCCAWNTPLLNFGVERLDFSPYPDISDRQIETILPKFGQITTVKFDGCRRITDRTLEALGIHCQLLSSLGLNRCTAITDKGIKALSRCQRLRYLMLWQAKNVSKEAVNYLEKHLPYLRTPIHSCTSANGDDDDDDEEEDEDYEEP